MEIEPGLALGISIVRTRVEDDRTPDMTLEELAKLCFRHARRSGSTWWTTTDDQRFRIACGALLLIVAPEDRGRIERALKMLRAINAMMQGIPVDMEKVVGEEGEEPVPLMGWWHEVAAEAA